MVPLKSADSERLVELSKLASSMAAELRPLIGKCSYESTAVGLGSAHNALVDASKHLRDMAAWWQRCERFN